MRYSDHQTGQGPAVLRQASSLGLEGIVSKRRDAPYRPGRGASWLKVKCRNREEIVVIGFTDPEGKREGFGALLAGYYDPSETLRYAGRVGTGFSAERLADLRKRLDASGRQGRLPSSCPRRRRARASIGSGQLSSPRSNSPAGPPTRSCATPLSRAYARIRARARSFTIRAIRPPPSHRQHP